MIASDAAAAAPMAVPGLISGELHFRADPETSGAILPAQLSAWLCSTDPGVSGDEERCQAKLEAIGALKVMSLAPVMRCSA